MENFSLQNSLIGMKYSVWFPTHGPTHGASYFRGWFERVFSQPAYRLDRERQLLVERSIREVCHERGWRLVSFQSTEMEVAAVVESDAKPERVIRVFKVAASLALAALDGYGPERKRFNRHARIRELTSSDRASATSA